MNTTIQSCNLALNSQMIIKNASMKGNIYPVLGAMADGGGK